MKRIYFECQSCQVENNTVFYSNDYCRLLCDVCFAKSAMSGALNKETGELKEVLIQIDGEVYKGVALAYTDKDSTLPDYFKLVEDERLKANIISSQEAKNKDVLKQINLILQGVGI